MQKDDRSEKMNLIINLQDFHDLNEKSNFAEGILLPFYSQLYLIH